MGCHSLLQEISLIQGLNRLLHCRRILYHLSHQGSPNNGRALCAKSLLLCLTLCEPMNHSQAGHSCFQKEKKKKTWGPGYCLRAAHCSHCSLFSFKLGWASVGTTIPQREPSDRRWRHASLPALSCLHLCLFPTKAISRLHLQIQSFFLFFFLPWVFIAALRLSLVAKSEAFCSPWASHCGGFSYCGAWDLERGLSSCGPGA